MEDKKLNLHEIPFILDVRDISEIIGSNYQRVLENIETMIGRTPDVAVKWEKGKGILGSAYFLTISDLEILQLDRPSVARKQMRYLDPINPDAKPHSWLWFDSFVRVASKYPFQLPDKKFYRIGGTEEHCGIVCYPINIYRISKHREYHSLRARTLRKEGLPANPLNKGPQVAGIIH